MDKTIKKALQRYAQIFHDGRQRNINEADTVMYLTQFFTDVLGYDLFSDITKEFQVRDRYCDIAIKLKGEVRFLVEAKANPMVLSDRHIEQAENYAARAGIQWVVLTNGVTWRLYHLTFESNGIEHDLAFECQLTPDGDIDESWQCLTRLHRDNVIKGELETFWEHKKSLSSNSLVRALFTEEALNALRRQLHKKASVRLELEDVAASLRRLLNPEILTEEIKIKKAKKRRKVSGPAEEAHSEDGDPTPGAPGVGLDSSSGLNETQSV